jgi:hypothetical protein
MVETHHLGRLDRVILAMMAIGMVENDRRRDQVAERRPPRPLGGDQPGEDVQAGDEVKQRPEGPVRSFRPPDFDQRVNCHTGSAARTGRRACHGHDGEQKASSGPSTKTGIDTGYKHHDAHIDRGATVRGDEESAC